MAGKFLSNTKMTHIDLSWLRRERMSLGRVLCELIRDHVHKVLNKEFNSGAYPTIKFGTTETNLDAGRFFHPGPDSEEYEYTTQSILYQHGDPIDAYMDLKIQPYAYGSILGHYAKNNYKWTRFVSIGVYNLEREHPSYIYQFWDKDKGIRYNEGVLHVNEPQGTGEVPYQEEWNAPEFAEWKTWRDLFRRSISTWFGQGKLRQNDSDDWKGSSNWTAGPAGATIQTLLIDCVRNLIDTEIKGSDDPHGEHRGDMHWQNRMAWEALGRLVQMLEKNQI